MSETARNKQTIRDLLAAADAGDVEGALAFYSPLYVDHDASESRAGGTSHFAALERGFRAFYAAFRGTRHTLHDLVAEGDRVAARISVESIHSGEIFGIAATGRAVRNDSIVIYRLEGGRIVERWCRERRTTRELLTSDSLP
jgi:C-1 hydroxylase